MIIGLHIFNTATVYKYYYSISYSSRNSFYYSSLFYISSFSSSFDLVFCGCLDLLFYTTKKEWLRILTFSSSTTVVGSSSLSFL